MAKYLQLIAGTVLLAGFALIAYLNLSLYAGRPPMDLELIHYHFSTEGVFIPWGPWFGLCTMVFTGMFLFASISPKT